MKNKVDRLQAIKEIIISYKISSQEDLLSNSQKEVSISLKRLFPEI